MVAGGDVFVVQAFNDMDITTMRTKNNTNRLDDMTLLSLCAMIKTFGNLLQSVVPSEAVRFLTYL